MTLPEVELLASGARRLAERRQRERRHPRQAAWWPDGPPDEDLAAQEQAEILREAQMLGVV